MYHEFPVLCNCHRQSATHNEHVSIASIIIKFIAFADIMTVTIPPLTYGVYDAYFMF